MKKLILAIMLAMTTSFVAAEDFKTSQHNFKFRSGDFGGEVRQEVNSTKDHIQITYYGVENLALDYRHVDNQDNVENRIRGTYSLYDNGTFWFKPRLEYRQFEGNSDDYWRARAIIGARHLINKDTTVWVDSQLSWNFGSGQDGNIKIDTNQARFGIDYSVNEKLLVGSFIQYETDKDWNKTGVFLGTTFSVNF
jgi:hypothetical protein